MTTINAVGNGLSGSTGTGKFVGDTSPTLVTPALGTPSSGNLSNCTSYSATALSASIATWTPVFTFATPGNLSVVYTNQQGYSQQIGNVFIVTFFLQCTPTFTTASGAVQITGLPAASHNSTNNKAFGAMTLNGTFTFPSGATTAVLQVPQNNSLLSIFGFGSGSGETQFTTSNFTSGSAIYISGTVTYIS